MGSLLAAGCDAHAQVRSPGAPTCGDWSPAVRPILPLIVLVPCVAAQELGDDPPMPPPVWEELLRLRARLEALEQQSHAGQTANGPVAIDLSGQELPALVPNGEHVLARPWYENLQLSGYGALTYLDSGGTGTTKNGSFLVKEASLFFDAQIWERAFLFSEVRLARYQFGSGFSLGEFYLQLTDLCASGGAGSLGLKAGRIEIPFGEEYLRWDANETALITLTAADPYGIDEGVELYGALGSLHWITAVTNGDSGSGADDSAAKLLCAKLYGEPSANLYLSASVLSTGSTESGALRLSGSTLTPVGASGPSTAGTSPNDEVDSLCWELDTRIASASYGLNLQFGRAQIDDDAAAFDRDLTWFHVEPGFRLRDDLELVLRWSEIGTFDDDEGYRFAGKILADGDVFGYDTRVLRRLTAGLRWSVNPHLSIKFEIGEDRIDLIDASPLDADNDERLFFGFEAVGTF